jgi:DNA-directed RNA polymerase subunit RPC12/RpoP
MAEEVRCACCGFKVDSLFELLKVGTIKVVAKTEDKLNIRCPKCDGIIHIEKEK